MAADLMGALLDSVFDVGGRDQDEGALSARARGTSTASEGEEALVKVWASIAKVTPENAMSDPTVSGRHRSPYKRRQSV
jgi:hypothetical protein